MDQGYNRLFPSNEKYILKTPLDSNGDIPYNNKKEIKNLAMDKNLYFAGFNLLCCVQNTMYDFLALPRRRNESMSFTILDDYIWITTNPLGNANATTHRTISKYINTVIPDCCILPGLPPSYFQPSLDEIVKDFASSFVEIFQKYETNAFFVYEGNEYTIFKNHKNKLRLDFIVN